MKNIRLSNKERLWFLITIFKIKIIFKLLKKGSNIINPYMDSDFIYSRSIAIYDIKQKKVLWK